MGLGLGEEHQAANDFVVCQSIQSQITPLELNIIQRCRRADSRGPTDARRTPRGCEICSERSV